MEQMASQPEITQKGSDTEIVEGKISLHLPVTFRKNVHFNMRKTLKFLHSIVEF